MLLLFLILLLPPSFCACRSNREASWYGFWPLDRTNFTGGAFLAHLYHADVRHLTSFPTRSADLLDLSRSHCALGHTVMEWSPLRGASTPFFSFFSYIPSTFWNPRMLLPFYRTFLLRPHDFRFQRKFIIRHSRNKVRTISTTWVVSFDSNFRYYFLYLSS